MLNCIKLLRMVSKVKRTLWALFFLLIYFNETSQVLIKKFTGKMIALQHTRIYKFYVVRMIEPGLRRPFGVMLSIM